MRHADSLGAAVDTDFILGMAKVKGVVKTLLDIDKVVGADTLKQVASQAHEA